MAANRPHIFALNKFHTLVHGTYKFHNKRQVPIYKLTIFAIKIKYNLLQINNFRHLKPH